MPLKGGVMQPVFSPPPPLLLKMGWIPTHLHQNGKHTRNPFRNCEALMIQMASQGLGRPKRWPALPSDDDDDNTLLSYSELTRHIHCVCSELNI